MLPRRALITGASAGIGAEFARQLAAEDYDLVLVARRRDRLDELAAELSAKTDVTVITADLSAPGEPQRVWTELEERGMQIDYLVNNAGVAGPNLLKDRDWDRHREFQQLMMGSVAQMCHLFIPAMRARGFGRVVNVASIAGLVTIPGSANYGPAKAYVVALSKELALLSRKDGVHVTALCPGFTDTEFHDASGLQQMKADTPRRVWYPASVVVNDGRKGVDRGRSVVVTGRLYRFAVPIMRTRIGAWIVRLFR